MFKSAQGLAVCCWIALLTFPPPFARGQATQASQPASQPAQAITVSLEADGIAISAGEVGKLKMAYPALLGGDRKQTAPSDVSVEKNSASMKYAGGGALTVALGKEGRLQFHFTGLPAGSKMRMEMEVPVAMKDGGKWATESGEPKPFPAEKGEQFIFKGNLKSFQLIGPRGGRLAVAIEHGWQQLQDNRLWNTESFGWMMTADLGSPESYYSVQIGGGSAQTQPAASGPAGATKLGFSLGDGGVVIDGGTMGRFTLTYPSPRGAGEKAYKLIEKSITGNKAALKYEGGGQIDLSVGADGTVAMGVASMPDDTKMLRMEMLIDFKYAEGGAWKVADAEEKPFPREKPAKPFLYQGNADLFALKNYEGRTIAFRIPRYSYIQLQDNREWNWSIFAFWFAAPYDKNVKDYQVKITGGASDTAGPKVLVDKFGQRAQADYPGKVTSAEELKADVVAEANWLASLKPPQWDPYGGLPGSGEKLGLKKTGFFHVEQKDGRWILVDPAGNAFFHLGVCGFGPSDDYTYVKGREQVYEWLPPRDGELKTAFHPDPYWNPDVLSFHLANLIRKTGRSYDPDAYQAMMIRRVRAWGFNSAGAFSPTFRAAQIEANFPYVSSVPLGPWGAVKSIPGATGAWDPFDETNRRIVEKAMADGLPKHADDPLLIGYFLVNEPLYENLPRAIPTLNGKFACKQRLVQALREKYKTVEAFNQAWAAQAGSLDELADRGLAVTTKDASADVRDFTGAFLEEYFRFVTETFRKHDKNHMLIGNRLQPGTINNEQLCRICGKYMDVVSFNYYTYGLDKDFLDRIRGWTGGRPMILSEFYFSSPKDSGLGGGGHVSTQEQRGLAYRNYVEQAASLGYVVGIEWFTLVDQSVTGRWFERYNGENTNTGLISVADRPWRPMLEHMMKTNYEIHEVILGKRPPFVFDDPRFNQTGASKKVVKIPRATGEIKMNGLAENWPGTPPEQISSKRLVMGPAAGGLECSFKLCRDDKFLYLLANVTDATPMMNEHKGDSIWSADAVELFIGHENLDQGGQLLFSDRQVLLSAGKADGQYQWHFANSPKQYECRMYVSANADGKGYTLEAAIPFEALGFTPKEEMEIRFDMAVDDSENGRGRDRQIMWNGTARNSGDRTHWGGAVFAK